MPSLVMAPVGAENFQEWRRIFAEVMPALQVHHWPEAGAPDFDPATVDYAYLWRPTEGILSRLPTLKAIFSMGAGVDGVLQTPDLPPGLPISRVVDPDMTGRMVEFACLAVLSEHRDLRRHMANQRDRRWVWEIGKPARDRTVGVMGLGALGGATAAMLTRFGFAVRGWSRTAKSVDGVTVFAGAEGLAGFLADTDILVCLLPLTQQTHGILNARTFAGLPRGARVINLARGGHLVEADLLAALEAGQISGAFLDVFATEPLPEDHPLWRHPGVTVTPHIASISSRETRARLVVDGIRKLEAGLPPDHLVDRARGY